MILDFSNNAINFRFEVGEENNVNLIELCEKTAVTAPKNDIRRCRIAELQLTGGNQNDHHGAKHTVTSESDSLRYITHRDYQNEFGRKIEFLLQNDKVELTAHYQLFEDAAAVRCWNEVKNVSAEPIGIEYLSSFTYTGIDEDNLRVYLPHNSWCSELAWKDYSLADLGFDRIYPFTLKRVGASNTGSWSSKEYLPMGAIANESSATIWQIENNGSWAWEIGDIANMLYLKLSGPTEQENGWYKELETNEIFEGVKVCLSFGKSFDDALGEMTKYRRKIFKNNKPNSVLPVIFNDYMNCLTGDPTTEKLLPIIDKAAALGAEYFCVDAGWYADGTWWETVGEWMPCGWRFPNGIKEVFDKIKEKGMIPGIWLEIEVMGINCPILDRFDDECFFMRHGKRIIDHGRYQLDFRNQKVRDHATKTIDRVVSEYGVGYIKMDYNIDAGLGTEVDSNSFGDGLLEHNRAYLEWIDEIKAKYPDLILENCGSGGMRMDYAMLEHCHIQSVTDQTEYVPMAVISANAPTAALPEQAAMWSYPKAKNDHNEAAYNMINSMFLRVHLSGEVANLDEYQLNMVKQGVDTYKKIRKYIPHSTPFYPLGLNEYKSQFAAVGIKSGEKRFLSVWRMEGEENKVLIPLDSPENARILYPKDSKCIIEKTEKGLGITFPYPRSAVVIEI